MPSIHDTAYPRLKALGDPRDLAEVYTPPTPRSETLAAELTRSPTASVCFLILLKTFQRLGYFVYVRGPRLDCAAPGRPAGRRSSRPTSVPMMPRGYADAMCLLSERICMSNRVIQDAQRALETVLRDAAQTKDDLADLINVGIEELIRQHRELPGLPPYGGRPMCGRP